MSTSSALMAYIVYVLTFAGLLRGVVGLAVFKGSPGCGIIHKPYIDGESRSSNIESSGGLRHYSIHLPPAYDPHVQYPLMISFHGGTKTKEEQEQLSQFSNNSINPNMIAVYPHGIKVSGRWDFMKYLFPGEYILPSVILMPKHRIRGKSHRSQTEA